MKSFLDLPAAAARLHVGIWSIVIVISVQAFNLFDRDMPWRGEWNWAVDWAGSGLIIIGPLLAGVAAVDGGKMKSERRLPQASLISRPIRAIMGLWLTSAVPAVTAYVLSVGIFLYIADSATVVPRTPALLLILAQASALSAYILLGSVIGRMLGAVVGAPASAVGAVTIYWSLGRGGGDFAPFDVGSATSSLLGLQFSTTYILLQLSYLMAFMAGCLAVHAAINTRFQTPTAAGIAMAITLSSVVPIAMPRFKEHEVSASTCVSVQVTVCVYPEHERFLPDLARDVSIVQQAASQIGIADLLPRVYVERIPGEGIRSLDDQRGRLEIKPNDFSAGKVPIADVVHAIVLPWHCPQLFGENPPPPHFVGDITRIADTLTLLVESKTEPELTVGDARKTVAAINRCES
ncbi:hypothetical protein [Salinispora arenicola]|uniref:hypothetical protein n=1 Tax=Salinispora arenicola TaxID=168697 RepID=UPI0003A711FE|nr:hypothetical protein [Salinispora arenicola]